MMGLLPYTDLRSALMGKLTYGTGIKCQVEYANFQDLICSYILLQKEKDIS
jgi:hypothetical protein